MKTAIQTVLAFETSCDDTSVALVTQQGYVIGQVSAHQDLAHEKFGGVVPEIAGRQHSQTILKLVDVLFKKTNANWSQVDAIAVTNRPGLVGSLIVGLVTAKSFSMARKIPFLGVNHLEGHLFAPFLSDEDFQPPRKLTFPFTALAVSGGHTTLYEVKKHKEYKILGTTRDDAAGEAFDKFAKMIGLGFPGGIKVDQLSKQGQKDRFHFPRPLLDQQNYEMSFSGLKSAAHRLISDMSESEVKANWADLCASFQEAIVDVLLSKLERAVEAQGHEIVVITGGVSANSRLRQRAEEWTKKKNLTLLIPPLRYCTDNAAMIGYAGLLRLSQGERSELSLAPYPQSADTDFLYE